MKILCLHSSKCKTNSLLSIDDLRVSIDQFNTKNVVQNLRATGQLSEHMFLREYREYLCGVTVGAAVSNLF